MNSAIDAAAVATTIAAVPLTTSPFADEHSTPSTQLINNQTVGEMKEAERLVAAVEVASPPRVSLGLAHVIPADVTITGEVNTSTSNVVVESATAAVGEYSPGSTDDSGAIHIQIRDAPAIEVEMELMNQESQQVIVPIVEQMTSTHAITTDTSAGTSSRSRLPPTTTTPTTAPTTAPTTNSATQALLSSATARIRLVNQGSQQMIITTDHANDHGDLLSPSATHIVTIHNIDIQTKETSCMPHPNTTQTLSPNTTRPLLAPVSKGYYKTVPYEILHLISSYLDGHSLSCLNRADTASHTVTSKKDLWAGLLEKPWNGDVYINHHDRAQLNGVTRVHQPRGYYRLRYEAAMENRRQQLRVHEISVQRVCMNHRSFLCHYLNDVLIAPMILLMFLLFTIFLFVQLSHNESLTWFTCWPLIVIASLLFFTTSLLYFKQFWFDSDGLLSSNFYSDSTSFIKVWIMDEVAGGQARFPHTCLWLMLNSVTLFLFFLSFKLTGTYLSEWSWWQVFLPLYLALLMTFICPKLGFFPEGIDHWRDNVTPWLISLIVFFGPMWAFLITLNVHLDVHPIRIMIIFVPLFILDGFVLITFNCIYLLDEEREDDEYENCNSVLSSLSALWVLLIGPFVTTQILLALKLDGESHMIGVAYNLVFIPLYFTQFLIFLFTIYAGIILRDDFDKVWDLFPHRPFVPIPEK